jgi:ribosomal protein S18 acetylase RimI-like enzyme
MRWSGLAMLVKKAKPGDIQGWLELAREVEPLFGPMADVPDFKATILRGINNNRGFCIKAAGEKGNDELAGAVLISKKHNMIAWLAVSGKYRKRGYGEALLRHAIDNLDSSRPIQVETFDSKVKDGFPAIRLYEKLGFKEVEKAGLNPGGVPIVLMVKNADSSNRKVS